MSKLGLPGCCLHFTGIQNEVCHKGVVYATAFPNYNLAPCTPHTFEQREGKPIKLCAQRELPTEDQIDHEFYESIRILEED